MNANCIVVVCPNIYGPLRDSRHRTPNSRPSTPVPRPDNSPVTTANLWKFAGSESTQTAGPSDSTTPRPRLTGWYIVEAIKEFLRVGREGEPPLHLEVNLQGFVLDHTRVVAEGNTASMHGIKWDPKNIYATSPPHDLGKFKGFFPVSLLASGKSVSLDFLVKDPESIRPILTSETSDNSPVSRRKNGFLPRMVTVRRNLTRDMRRWKMLARVFWIRGHRSIFEFFREPLAFCGTLRAGPDVSNVAFRLFSLLKGTMSVPSSTWVRSVVVCFFFLP